METALHVLELLQASALHVPQEDFWKGLHVLQLASYLICLRIIPQILATHAIQNVRAAVAQIIASVYLVIQDAFWKGHSAKQLV